MVAVLEAWVANKDAAMLPFDAKITSRYADHLGEVVEVKLLGEMTVLPIFRNPKKKRRCTIILKILNSSIANRNAEQVARILAREKHCVPILSAAGLLVQAAAHAGCTIVREMLQAGFNPEHTSFHDEHLVVTALGSSAFESRTDVMAILVENCASIHGPDNSVPPIAMAVRGGVPATIAWLLERGARPDGNPHSNRHAYANPLACAIRMLNYESARMLVEAGALTQWYYDNGKYFSAIYALLYGFHMQGNFDPAALYDFVKLFIDHGATFEAHRERVYSLIAINGGMDNIVPLLRAPLAQERGLDLQEAIDCPICLETRENCCQLGGCSHTFCRACIEKQWRSVPASFNKCALCRKAFDTIIIGP